MIYPLTERRISGYDRRRYASGKSKNSQGNQNRTEYGTSSERRIGRDRRVLKLDREKLLASITPKQSKSKWQRIKFMWQDFIKPSLIPLVIGGASFYVTQEVTDQQIESTEKIAKDNQHNTKIIADAGLETQRLMQMAGIFSDIINLLNQPPEKNKTTEDTLKQKVKSLSVYGDEALPFLIQLRDEYKREGHDQSGITVSEIAATTIEGILKLSQHQIEMEFVGDQGKRLILPRREYINYNLSGSKFKDVNLYEANFSRSSLQNVQFIDADLRKADFSDSSLIKARFINTDEAKSNLNLAKTNFDHANLKNVTFKNVDLSNVNFEKAYLKGVKFEFCKHVGKAMFSMDQLLQADTEPFKSLSTNQYSLLLMKHEDNLTDIHKNNAIRLKKVYNKLNIANFDSLRKEFKELHKSMVQKNPNYSQRSFAGLFPWEG